MHARQRSMLQQFLHISQLEYTQIYASTNRILGIFLLQSGARTWATFVVILINYKLTPKRVPWGWLVTPWYVELIWFHRGQLHGGSANIRRGTLEALRRYLRTFLSPH